MTETDARSRADPRSTDEIVRLFEVAGCEGETISELDGCVARLHEVQQAKAALSALSALSAAELRVALRSRREALGGEPA